MLVVALEQDEVVGRHQPADRAGLGQAHPVAAVRVPDREAVHDGVEEPSQADAVVRLALELGLHRAGGERTDLGLDLVAVDVHGQRDRRLAPRAVEEPVEREQEVLEALDRELVPAGEPAEHEVRDPEVVALAGDRQPDLARHEAETVAETRPIPTTASSS